jgi:stress response protein SCP2
MIKNAFIRVVDGRNNQEICRYSLTDDYSGMTALILGEVYRRGAEWKFNAVGQGTSDNSIGALSARYQ